jgi:Flp pilus assembly protein TadG
MTNKLQIKQKELGQSMVELALTLTILLVLLAGTVDLGRALFTWLEMRDAAQEGASYASICPSGNVEARVRANLNPIYTYAVTISPGTSQGATKTVSVSTDLPITMPFLSTILSSSTIPINATINDTILTSECP